MRAFLVITLERLPELSDDLSQIDLMTKLSCPFQRAFICIRLNGWHVVPNHKQKQKTLMKIKMIACSALTAALLVGCCTEKGEAEHHHHKDAWQAKLMAKAKISKETAEQTARAKVPNGTIREGEIEKEHGKLIWSFDMTTPDTKDITEINVDAMTGEVVSMQQESPESEAKEAAGEPSKPKKAEEDEDKD